MSQFDHRANIKFVCTLWKSAAETLQALQTVYGDNALKKIVYDWYNCFRSGQEMLVDEPRSGKRSSSVKAETIQG
jgi:hypothetical protein